MKAECMTAMSLDLQPRTFLPGGGYAGTLVARVWRPDVQGPSGVARNRVDQSEKAAPRSFGLHAFMANLAQRGLLGRGL